MADPLLARRAPDVHATAVRIRAAVLPHTGAALDRLVSHRLPLEGIGEAFDLLRAGHARRAVITLRGARRDAAP